MLVFELIPPLSFLREGSFKADLWDFDTPVPDLFNTLGLLGLYSSKTPLEAIRSS